MATVACTRGRDLVSCETFVAAPPERVFQAITDPSQLAQWWGQKGLYRTTSTEMDLRVGGKWKTQGLGVDGNGFTVCGEYLEIDPPRTLVYTWIAPWCGDLTTTVRWELAATKGGTQVKIHHSGFDGNAKAAQDHGQGWQRVLGWMQNFVENGATVDSRG